MSRRIGVIDLGTSSIKALVGEIDSSGTIHVIGVGKVNYECPSFHVTDKPGQASEAVHGAVKSANEMAETSLTSFLFGIGGDSFSLKLQDATVSIPDEDRPVGERDVERVLDLATFETGFGRRTLSVEPRGYALDGQGGVSNPVGLYGTRLDVTVELLSAPSRIVEVVEAMAEDAGLSVALIIPTTWALGSFFSRVSGPHDGRVIFDLGYNSTVTSVYRGEDLVNWKSIPVGGKQITGDLQAKLNVERKDAERIKRTLGLRDHKNAERNLEFEDFSGQSRKVTRGEVQEVISSRVKETFDMALESVDELEGAEFREAGVTLIGGTAKIPRLGGFLEERYDFTARVGVTSPRVVGLQDILNNPVYANPIGLLLKGTRVMERKRPTGEREERNPLESIKKRFMDLLRNSLHC